MAVTSHELQIEIKTLNEPYTRYCTGQRAAGQSYQLISTGSSQEASPARAVAMYHHQKHISSASVSGKMQEN